MQRNCIESIEVLKREENACKLKDYLILNATYLAMNYNARPPEIYVKFAFIYPCRVNVSQSDYLIRRFRGLEEVNLVGGTYA